MTSWKHQLATVTNDPIHSVSLMTNRKDMLHKDLWCVNTPYIIAFLPHFRVWNFQIIFFIKYNICDIALGNNYLIILWYVEYWVVFQSRKELIKIKSDARTPVTKRKANNSRSTFDAFFLSAPFHSWKGGGQVAFAFTKYQMESVRFISPQCTF